MGTPTRHPHSRPLTTSQSAATSNPRAVAAPGRDAIARAAAIPHELFASAGAIRLVGRAHGQEHPKPPLLLEQKEYEMSPVAAAAL